MIKTKRGKVKRHHVILVMLMACRAFAGAVALEKANCFCKKVRKTVIDMFYHSRKNVMQDGTRPTLAG